MIVSTQLKPGIIIRLNGKIYSVESVVKVSVASGNPLIKTQLKDISLNKIVEKTFKLDQEVEKITLQERELELLYLEGDNFLFLDIHNLEHVLISKKIVGDRICFLKEGIVIKATFYGDTPSSVDVPQFMELMVVETESPGEKGDSDPLTNSMKMAVLETGAHIDVPLFIETGDIIKVDTQNHEYIQRI